MHNDELLHRINSNPDICGGKPIIRGMRIRVVDVLELLASGMTHQEILIDYPDLEEEDLKACMVFAAKVIRLKHISNVINVDH